MFDREDIEREETFSGFGSISPFTGLKIVSPDKEEVLSLIREYNTKVGNGLTSSSILDYLGVQESNKVYKKKLSNFLRSFLKSGTLEAVKARGRGEFSPGHNYYYDPSILDRSDVYMRGSYSFDEFLESSRKERELFGR